MLVTKPEILQADPNFQLRMHIYERAGTVQ